MINEMSLSKTYTKVFRIFGKHVGKLLFGTGIPIGIGMIPLTIFMCLMIPNAMELGKGYVNPAVTFFFLKQFVPLFVGLGVVSAVLLWLGEIFAISYLTNVAQKAVQGEDLTIRQACAGAWKSFGRVLLTTLAYLLVGVVVMGIVSLAIGYGIYKAYAASAYTTMILLALVLSIAMMGIAYFLIHFNFSYPAAVVDKRSGFGAMGQSFRMFTKGGYGRNLGHILLMALALNAASSVVGGIASAILVGTIFGGVIEVGIVVFCILLTAMVAVMLMILVPLYTIEYLNSKQYIEIKREQLQGEEK